MHYGKVLNILDLDYFFPKEDIKQVVVKRSSPFLVYQEGSAIVRAVRDHFSNEIGEILIDDVKIFHEKKNINTRQAAKRENRRLPQIR